LFYESSQYATDDVTKLAFQVVLQLVR